MSDNPGILTLTELVYKAFDGDDKFTDTVYRGPQIVAARADMPESPFEIQDRNLICDLVAVQLLRRRIGVTDPEYRSLLLAMQDKAANHPRLKDVFGKAIHEIISPYNPPSNINGKALGFAATGWVTPVRIGHVREEYLTVNIWVFKYLPNKTGLPVLTGE